MRYAFTMIELIFVIVVLGILAAVAIPKLSATRDDALIARTSQSIATAAMEIATYAVANGKIEDDLSRMSNAIEMLVVRNEAVLDVPNRAVDLKMGTVADCIKIHVISSGVDENLTVAYGAGGDNLCDSLHNVFDSKAYPLVLKGATVVH
jgi:general secretion pathway protein G